MLKEYCTTKKGKSCFHHLLSILFIEASVSIRLIGIVVVVFNFTTHIHVIGFVP